MSHQDIIEKLWDQRDQINFIEDNEAKKNVESVLNLLDEGKLRVCEKKENDWHVNQWLKKAILLSFRIQDMEIILAVQALKMDLLHGGIKFPQNSKIGNQKIFNQLVLELFLTVL